MDTMLGLHKHLPPCMTRWLANALCSLPMAHLQQRLARHKLERQACADAGAAGPDS